MKTSQNTGSNYPTDGRKSVMRKWIKITGIILEFVVIGFVIIFVVGTNVVKAKDRDQDLIKAADSRRWERVKRILNEGADVNAEDINGRTALFQASKYGDKQVVDFLKARGAKQEPIR
jgi:ankyrin repeat protein